MQPLADLANALPPLHRPNLLPSPLFFTLRLADLAFVHVHCCQHSLQSNGRTLVFDTRGEGTTYLSNYHHTKQNDGRRKTAHQKMCDDAGLNEADCIGGSVKRDGGGNWHVEFNSGTLNSSKYGEKHGVYIVLAPTRACVLLLQASMLSVVDDTGGS